MKQWYWKKSTQSFLKPQDLVFIDSSKLIFCYLAFTKKAKFSKQSVSHNINRLESLHFQNWRASTTKATGFSKYLMVFKTDYWITLKISYISYTKH